MVLELMGHRRLAGLVTEVEIGGASFLRLDVPGEHGEWRATQFYSPSAVYCMTPTTEGIAREVAERNQPEPVHRWELKAIEAPETVQLHPDYLPFESQDDEAEDY
jgi:hypothetical protein